MGTQCQTLFLGSKITADGDCNHEIKRHLLLGREAMTNLDSVTIPIKLPMAFFTELEQKFHSSYGNTKDPE